MPQRSGGGTGQGNRPLDPQQDSKRSAVDISRARVLVEYAACYGAVILGAWLLIEAACAMLRAVAP